MMQIWFLSNGSLRQNAGWTHKILTWGFPNALLFTTTHAPHTISLEYCKSNPILDSCTTQNLYVQSSDTALCKTTLCHYQPVMPVLILPSKARKEGLEGWDMWWGGGGGSQGGVGAEQACTTFPTQSHPWGTSSPHLSPNSYIQPTPQWGDQQLAQLKTIQLFCAHTKSSDRVTQSYSLPVWTKSNFSVCEQVCAVWPLLSVLGRAAHSSWWGTHQDTAGGAVREHTKMLERYTNIYEGQVKILERHINIF